MVIVDLQERRRVRLGLPPASAQPARPHPSLGACPECGSERLHPLVRTGQTAPEAVRCECCFRVLSIDELQARRAGTTTVLRVVETDAR